MTRVVSLQNRFSWLTLRGAVGAYVRRSALTKAGNHATRLKLLSAKTTPRTLWSTEHFMNKGGGISENGDGHLEDEYGCCKPLHSRKLPSCWFCERSGSSYNFDRHDVRLLE